jgi:AraC-like DNA-binding protein
MDIASTSIPYYQEINEFLASITSIYRTRDPLLYCLRMKADSSSSINNYKPPFRKAFYFIGLVTNAGQTEITYDNTRAENLNSFLVFQSPGLIYSFVRDPSANGYLVYFKPECFSFFRPDFEKEFPFFDVLHTNFYRLHQPKFLELAPHFEDVFSAYENSGRHAFAVAKLLALLYLLGEHTTAFNQVEQSFTTPQQFLMKKFIQLVNNFYIEKRSVEEYAALLNVTPNHLSQSVKLASGRNALSFINERIMTEARSLIRYTTFDMAEVAYRLNFSDPANFGKFFKKHETVTPLDYRKKLM